MHPKKTPYIDGVSVSSAETPCAARDFDCPIGCISDPERRLIKALVKEYGWKTTRSGILKPGHIGWGNW